MKKYLPLLICLLCFIIFESCHKKKRSSGTGTITLDPAANIVINGQNVTFQYNTSSQQNGFSITFSNVGSATCSNVSIETTNAYGLVSNNQTFSPSPINASMPQYTCTQNGKNIVLSEAPPLSSANFRPWVDDFNITIGKTVFTVTVDTTLTASQTLTRGAQPEMNLAPSFTGCGLNGTVLQRVYDCSKMITNYGATVTGDAGTAGTNAACGEADPNPSCAYYTQFTNPNTQDATLFWFVVSCPAGTVDSVLQQQQSCSWLTPVVTSTQPALDTNTANIDLFTLATLTGYQPRLLFSGKLVNGGNGYDFGNVNGFSESVALTYICDGANCGGSGPSSNPGNGATGTQPTPSPTTVCAAMATQPLNHTYSSTTFATTDAYTRDLISLASGATIAWQVPSYPMLNILTGGTPTGGSAYCTSNNGGDRPACDEPNALAPNGSNVGFNAINIPGFSESTAFSLPEIMWSSSSLGGGFAWVFVPLDLGVGGGVDVDDPSVALGVRCVSPAWF